MPTYTVIIRDEIVADSAKEAVEFLMKEIMDFQEVNVTAESANEVEKVFVCQGADVSEINE